MKKRIIGASVLVAGLGAASVWRLAFATPQPVSASPAAPVAPDSSIGTSMSTQSPECQHQEQVIAGLLKDFEGINLSSLEALPPRDIRPYQLPTPGIDVMRVVMEETYSIDGIGQDTVPLRGWIAVRHGDAHVAPGFTTLSWETAIVDTEFVGLELDGESKLFGPVHIVLDPSRPRPIGHVGRITLPAAADKKLEALGMGGSPVHHGEHRAASTRVAQAQPGPVRRSIAVSKTIQKPLGAQTSGPVVAPKLETLDPNLQRIITQACKCTASVEVKIQMPLLKLEMATADPVTWYSIVTTIPPVGETASIALEPITLLSAGRKVGVLESGIVKFREVVRFVPVPDPKLVCVATVGARGKS
jgi:hypothetical protein